MAVKENWQLTRVSTFSLKYAFYRRSTMWSHPIYKQKVVDRVHDNFSIVNVPYGHYGLSPLPPMGVLPYQEMQANRC